VARTGSPNRESIDCSRCFEADRRRLSVAATGVVADEIRLLHHLPPAEQRQEIDALTDRLRTARAELADLRSRHETEVDRDAETGYRRDLIRLRIFVLDSLIEWLETVEIDRSAEV